jgi:hypothetical protein
MSKYRSKREKLEAQNHSELVAMPPNVAKRYPVGKLYIPSGQDIEKVIREIPNGEFRTCSAVRDDLGQRHGGATTCAMVFGILWRVAAEAAEEDRQSGKIEPAPYWRIVRDDLSLNENFPGGVEGHATHLIAEGHVIEPSVRGSKLRVLAP